ncbi:MAG TPA: helix-turn-helix transcriptional regulator [Flavobacterium sp.]
MKNKVQAFRTQRQMTQTELSEKSGLSLRTIQRIESGAAAKGYTLKSIASALEIDISDLVEVDSRTVGTINIGKAKTINIAALSFIVIPFGNLIFPSLLMRGTSDLTRKTAIDILGVQILWTFISSILLIVSPAIQVAFKTKVPVLIVVLVLSFSINAAIIIRNAISLDKSHRLSIALSFRFL